MLTFLMQSMNARATMLIGLESILIVGSLILATMVVTGGQEAWSIVGTPGGFLRAALVALVCQACLYYTDLYDLRIIANRRELVARTFHSLAAASIILAAVYALLPDLGIGPGAVFAATFVVMATIPGWRVIFESAVRHVAPRERLVIVGSSSAAVGLASELTERRYSLGLEIVGFVTAGKGRMSTGAFHVLGDIADIPAIVRQYRVDRVVVSLADARGSLPMDQLLDMKMRGVTFDYLASVYERYTGKIAIENLRPSWLIFSDGFRTTPRMVGLKRLLDIVIALGGLAVTAPLMLLVALAVRLTSPGPALYHQQRVGERGRVFTVHKFRSMRVDAEASSGAVWSHEGDTRTTPVGRFIRAARLDELPQLWNILLGDMSLVGPRPERPEFIEQLTELIPYYGQRHVVKPGLTGWAQVRYQYGSSVEDAMEKLQYDLFYIKNLSLALDLLIVFSTIKTVVSRRGI